MTGQVPAAPPYGATALPEPGIVASGRQPTAAAIAGSTKPDSATRHTHSNTIRNVQIAMNAKISSTGFRAVIGFALSCLILLSPSTVAAQANLPLDGVFSTGNWRVRFEDKSGIGVFTAVGNGSRKIGESFLKVSARISYNSWRGRAFDRTFSTVQESSVSIKGDVLTITPKTGPAYVMTRVRTAAAATTSAAGSSRTEHAQNPTRDKSRLAPAKASGGSGSGCSPVQCHGITQAGNRCRRTTTNCSGNCWQH